ncbi:tetratricopeptide repeat protein [Helicobacter felis]|uniref:tetratricopeptide repeat protein n=1 Tax=Helicobacter felis TaxID=214 RepID=UPI0018F823B5|nr:SEL1-like repeat protein [Helicobacter felis]
MTKSMWRVSVAVLLTSISLQAAKLGESQAYKNGQAASMAHFGASSGMDTSTDPTTDCKQALKYFKQAIQEKDFAGYAGLGELYQSGCEKVVKKDTQKAIQNYEKAGQMGWGEGYATLGQMYHDGAGVPKSKKKVAHYLALCRKSKVKPKVDPNSLLDPKADACKAVIYGLVMSGD